jgi:hypothetical protein
VTVRTVYVRLRAWDGASLVPVELTPDGDAWTVRYLGQELGRLGRYRGRVNGHSGSNRLHSVRTLWWLRAPGRPRVDSLENRADCIRWLIATNTGRLTTPEGESADG